MNLESQICTIEQAKRLAELGVDQTQSIVIWHVHELGAMAFFRVSQTGPQYSAFTVAELGVMLPAGYDTMCTYEGWRCYDCDGQDIYEVSYGYRYEAECRAAAIIFLLENGKLKAEEVNERLKIS
jgi:hypothetical protein